LQVFAKKYMDEELPEEGADARRSHSAQVPGTHGGVDGGGAAVAGAAGRVLRASSDGALSGAQHTATWEGDPVQVEGMYMRALGAGLIHHEDATVPEQGNGVDAGSEGAGRPDGNGSGMDFDDGSHVKAA
jgi:hypothetical protein